MQNTVDGEIGIGSLVSDRRREELSIGIVVNERRSNSDARNFISYPSVYYVFFADRGLIGPLFKAELSAL